MKFYSFIQVVQSKLFDTVEVFRSKHNPLLESNKAKVGSFEMSVLASVVNKCLVVRILTLRIK